MCAEKLSSVLGAKKGMVAQRSSRTKSQQEEALTLEAPSATREAHRKFTGCCKRQKQKQKQRQRHKDRDKEREYFSGKVQKPGTSRVQT